MNEPKVLVFSIALIGYDRIFQHCINTHRAYCAQHGYDYVLIDKFPGIPDKEESTWLKVALMIEALKGKYDWVFFVDADCEIREHTPKIESLKVKDKYLYLSPGHSGFINAGVLIANSSQESIDFFENVLDSAGESIPELLIPELSGLAWSENPNIIHFAKDNPSVFLLDHRSWNNNSSWTSESYIFHYSGGTFRDFYLSEYSNKIDRIMGSMKKKIYLSYLRFSPKLGSLKKRLNNYMNFYRSHYPEFRSWDSKVTAKIS